MNWMDKLERKFGRYAIPNLMYYVIMLNALGLLISMAAPGMFRYLSLDVGAVLHGQVWRVVTFLMQPPTGSILIVAITLYFNYLIGRNLEAVWGTFRFNLYFFTGVLLHVVIAFIVYLITGISFPLGTQYLSMSMFFMFALIFPDAQFMLYFALPVKGKYLAYIDAVYFGYAILKPFLPGAGSPLVRIIYWKSAMEAAASLFVVLIFWLSSKNMRAYSPREVHRKKKYKKAVHEAKRERTYEGGAKHKCAVCGRTELDDETLEFRYCSKCNGNYEYCQDHLFTHEHVK